MGREASTCRRSGKPLPASVKKSNAQESRKFTKNLGDKGALAGVEPKMHVFEKQGPNPLVYVMVGMALTPMWRNLFVCIQVQLGDELGALRGEGALATNAGRPRPEVDLTKLSAKASLRFTYTTHTG